MKSKTIQKMTRAQSKQLKVVGHCARICHRATGKKNQNSVPKRHHNTTTADLIESGQAGLEVLDFLLGIARVDVKDVNQDLCK
jgi:adenine deaminase